MIACHRLGFEAVGFEMDKGCYDRALTRLTNEQQQRSIFDAEREPNVHTDAI